MGGISALCTDSSNTFSSSETPYVCVFCQTDNSGTACGNDYDCTLTMNYTGITSVNNQTMSQNTVGDGWYELAIPSLVGQAGTYEFSSFCTNNAQSGSLYGQISISSPLAEISGGSSVQPLNKSLACSYIYSFLRNNQGNFTSIDLGNLKLDILKQENMLVESLLLKEWSENYELNCFPLTERDPFLQENIFRIKGCSPNIESSMSLVDWGLNLRIPLPSIAMGDLKCSTVDVTKWLFVFEDTGTGFDLKGIRLLLPLIFFSIASVLLWKKVRGKVDRLERSQKRHGKEIRDIKDSIDYR